MSGHSKWSTIKHKKALRDHVKGNLFTKAAKNITVAVKKGNSIDPEANFSLRLAVDQARAINMPRENIERAIERGRGKAEGESLEELLLEGYGPTGVGYVIEVVSDNHNRAVAEIKNILEKRGGRLGEPGSVQYLFEKVATVASQKKLSEQEQLELIDLGVVGITEKEEGVVVTLRPSAAQKIAQQLKSWGHDNLEMNVGYIPKLESSNKLGTEELVLVEALLAHEDVQEVYTT